MTDVRARLRVGMIGFLVGLAAWVPAVCSHDGRDHADIRRLEHDVADAKIVRSVATETVTVHVKELVEARAESNRLRSLVHVVDATTLSVRTTPSDVPTLVTVPAAVTLKFVADSVLIAKQERQLWRYEALARADSLVIAKQDSLIRGLKKRNRCGRKCGIALGVGGTILASVALNQVQRMMTRTLTSVLPPVPR